MKKKASRKNSPKPPTKTSKERWIRGIEDTKLKKILATRAKINRRAASPAKRKGSAPAFIFMRPVCRGDDCNWPDPDAPPDDPCHGMNWVWQPALAVRLATFAPCPSDADLTRIKQALRGRLSRFGFSDPDVRPSCQGGLISISIWSTTVQPGSCADQARERSRIPDDILQNEIFGIYINADLIRWLAQKAFEAMPKTLSATGNPDDNGPIHLTSLSVGFIQPNTIETYIGGYDERPWPDISFTTKITDQLGDMDHPGSSQKTCVSRTDTSADRTDEVVALLLGGISTALTFVLPVLFPLTSFALLNDIQALLIQPNNPPTGGAGCRVLELLPDQIPLPQTGFVISPPVPVLARRIPTRPPTPQKKKLVLTYDKRPTVDDRGLIVSGTTSLVDRTPVVHIIGPSSLSISSNAQEGHGLFTAEPDDFFGDIAFVWSGGGTIQNPAAQLTDITFSRGTAKPGDTFQRTVTVRVTDQEGSTATASLNVSISVMEQGDLPALCLIKPWLPECQPASG
jgi:hypothetical protein